MPLDATPGSPSANAYCTVSAATAFLEERLGAGAWDVAQLPLTLMATREAALITATRLLDAQVIWRGSPSTPTQALGWPRSGLTTAQGQPIDPATVPQTIQQATAYYALALLEAEGNNAGSGATGQVKRRRLGQTEIEYFEGAGATTHAAQTTLPLEIRRLLTGWGMLVGGVVVPLVRT